MEAILAAIEERIPVLMAALCFKYCCLHVFSIFLPYKNVRAKQLSLIVLSLGSRHKEKELCPVAFHLSGFPSLPPIL